MHVLSLAPARRLLLATVAGLLAGLALTSAADARLIEIGAPTLPLPSCPAGPCLAVTRTTGYQVRAEEQRNLWRANRTGRIVAVTLRLGDPTKEQIDFFEESMGGRARASITVLRLRSGLRGEVRGQSEIVRIDRYFGSTVQIPFERSVPITRGDYVALSVPTWAPVLAVGASQTTDWRAHRNTGECDNFTAQTRLRTGTGRFQCRYSAAQLAFSATMITEPTETSKSAVPSKPRVLSVDEHPATALVSNNSAAALLYGGAPALP